MSAPQKMIARCPWPGIVDAEYARYHDTEWGVPLIDDQKLFEKLVLEGFQAGLSWLTILKKRENFRTAFHHFDAVRVARYGDLFRGALDDPQDLLAALDALGDQMGK